jgi:hypothetical protein
MTDLITPPQHAGTRDFSRPRKRLVFVIDNDTFEAAPVLPGDTYAEFVTFYTGTGETQTYQQQHDQLKEALRLALMPDSYERFANRLTDKTNPIDDDQLSDVILWLLEAYGMRPTSPSQLSSDGPLSPESGMSSTGEQQPPASTPEISPPIAS